VPKSGKPDFGAVSPKSALTADFYGVGHGFRVLVRAHEHRNDGLSFRAPPYFAGRTV
jgi:hypothetical protein